MRHSGGNHGEIWCLAAQPRRVASKGGVSGPARYRDRDRDRDRDPSSCQKLAAACADGAVVLLSTEDGDLQFKKQLAPPSAKKARVLSIAFQNQTTLVAGYADSVIRILDVRNGRLIWSLSLRAGPVGAPRDTLVWTVKILPGGDIVSGDSTGEVRFWDGQTYTLRQRLQCYQADVLDLEVSADGQTVVSGGMDRCMAVYKWSAARKGGVDGGSRWSTMARSRLHSHDVKAMVAFGSKVMSVIVSGGSWPRPRYDTPGANLSLPKSGHQPRRHATWGVWQGEPSEDLKPSAGSCPAQRACEMARRELVEQRSLGLAIRSIATCHR